MRQMNGVLEFVDTADFTSMGGGEHFMCTDVEWDPTGWPTDRPSFRIVPQYLFLIGRYVMTGVSWWGHKVDNAYWLWNFQGKILKRSSVEKFCQLVWRPRYCRFSFSFLIKSPWLLTGRLLCWQRSRSRRSRRT